MVRYSPDLENATKSRKSRGSNLPVRFKNTCETAQAVKGMPIGKAPSIWRMSDTGRSSVYRSVLTQVELVGVPRPSRGAGPRSVAQEGAECLLHVLKNAESHAELQSSDVDSPVHWAHPGEQSPQDVVKSTLSEFSCHVEMVLTEKEQIVPEPAEEVGWEKKKKKRYPRRKGRNKNLWPGNKFHKNKCK